MLKRYGDYALLASSERADKVLDEGDMAGAEVPVIRNCHRAGALVALRAARYR
jgi:hypothetical protein